MLAGTGCSTGQECWSGTGALLPVQECWDGTGYSIYLSSGVGLGQFVPADCEALWDGVRTSCILAR